MSPPGASDRPKDRGWAVRLRYRGLTVADRRVRGDAVLLGEDPACAVVVPGLGPAVRVASGATLHGVPGVPGELFQGDSRIPFAGPCPLAPGDRAEFHLGDAITVELRRETYARLPFATLWNPRELVRQLAIGAAVVATVAVLARIETPVNTLVLRGEPDADPDERSDSLLVRAMFAAEAVAPPIAYRELYTFQTPPPAPPPAPAPMPVLQTAEIAVPVPLAEVDAPAPVKPRTRSRRVRDTVTAELEVLTMLSSLPDDDVLADAVVGTNIAVGTLEALNVPTDLGPDVAAILADDAAPPVEAVMGPGSDHDEPVPSAIPPIAVGSHDIAAAEPVRGAVDGLAAAAPRDVCEDPAVTRASQLDLVFVVDVSTTMTFMLDRIEKQIAQVDAEARSQALDPRYGLVVFVDDVRVANAGKPYADLAALQAELATWQAFTAGNRQIGSPAQNLDWPENSLDAVHAAATEFNWRPAATTLRMVVHATDDDFAEAPAVQSGQPVHHTYRDTAAALRAAEIRMFSFAARVGGECECLDVRAGLFTHFNGQPSLPDATGGAVFDIDAVASGKLGFAAAIAGAIRSGVCTRYPLSPFATAQ